MRNGEIMKQGRLALRILVLALGGMRLAAADELGENPYEPQQDRYATELLIVGGSSGGTAAAVTAGRLGIPTVWTLRAARDLGGLSTNAINPDSDLPIRYIGGLALEYDVVARYTTGFHVGGRHNGEGYFCPLYHLFNYTRQQVDALDSVRVLANLVPLSVEKDPQTKRVTAVVFGHRLQPKRKIVVEPQVTIDAEIEGDVAYLAGVSMTLLREGRVASDDPTRDRESYAGRIFTPQVRIQSLAVAGGPLLPGSTQAADERPATMAWNGSIILQDYGQGSADSPWVLKTPPPGYDPAEFAWWEKGVYGVTLGDNERRWNIDHYLSTIEGWRLPDGRHVLESMDVNDRECNEKAHLAHVIRGLWHLQHTRGQYRYGIPELDFREGVAPKYRLSDFGTATNAGDAPLPGLIYMREGRRMVNDHVFGGRLIEDDGSGRPIQKSYWHPRAAYFNAMLVDIHGVHRETVPGSGPEGMQLLRLAGHPNFGVPCIPCDVFLPRASEATGLLVAAAGAYTHQAYAAFPRMETGRIAQGHACAVAAQIALQERTAPHRVDARKVQIRNLSLHGQSLVYLEDTIPGTAWQLVDQMLGCRRVPERNDQGVFQREEFVTVAEARVYLERLLRDYCDEPAPPPQLDAALAALGPASDAAVTRGQLLAALTRAAGLSVPAAAPPPAADVPGDSELGRQLAAWIQAGWIAAGARQRFQPDQPVPFSEFKRHAYHAFFGRLAPETVRAVDCRPWLAHDTFNRPDGPLPQLAGGLPISGTGRWKIEAGQLRPERDSGTDYLLTDTGQADVEAAVDVFLEQTQNAAAAGLAVRGTDAQNMERFLLQAEGPAVHVRIDTLVNGRHVDEVRQVWPTLRRGFTLRLAASGDELTYSIDGREVYRQRRAPRAGATLVGLLNGGGEASRFDNLEVRAVP